MKIMYIHVGEREVSNLCKLSLENQFLILLKKGRNEITKEVICWCNIVKKFWQFNIKGIVVSVEQCIVFSVNNHRQ